MTDPTSVSIDAQNGERARLRAEVDRLSKALVAAYTDIEVVTAERDQFRKIADAVAAAFEKGYDQAVDEIRGHFAKAGQHGVVAEIAATFRKVGAA